MFEMDSWLSEVLGFSAYRLNVVDGGIDVNQDIAALKGQIAGNHAFAYVRLPAAKVDLCRRFSAHGFYVVDVPVTFHRPAIPRTTENRVAGIVVRRAEGKEREIARSIAGSCIVFSRFHMDPGFSKSMGDRVNHAWLDSYCRGVRGEEVLVAEIGGRIAGFTAILRSHADGKPCRVVDLIGVEKSFQRHGVGQAMMEAFIDDTSAQGLGMHVTTQAANVPAVNLYERNGFRLAESALVLHKHFP